MARNPISPETKAAVLADWRLGKMSQRDIADKHHIGNGSVAKITKGIEQDGEAIVSAAIFAKQSLAGQSEQFVSAVNTEVSKRLEHIQFFADATIKNLSSMVGKINKTTSIKEHREAQAAIKDGKETVLGKQPETAIQINNSNANTLNIEDVDLSLVTDTELADLQAGRATSELLDKITRRKNLNASPEFDPNTSQD